MNKTIFNTYVPMESQEQCDRMKQVCIDNGLKIWCYEDAFLLLDVGFYFFDTFSGFAVDSYNGNPKVGYSKVTESEWLELLSNHKSQSNGQV